MKIKKYRQRAHLNPYSKRKEEYSYRGPSLTLFKKLGRFPDILDLGCGFGQMTKVLATNNPDAAVLGLEIRPMAAAYCEKTLETVRNAEVLCANASSDLLSIIPRNSLDLLFVCFPDPHFNARKHKRRVINKASVLEFDYVLRASGRLVHITDVPELFAVCTKTVADSGLFVEDTDEEMCSPLQKVCEASDEADKVRRDKPGQPNRFVVYKKSCEGRGAHRFS